MGRTLRSDHHNPHHYRRGKRRAARRTSPRGAALMTSVVQAYTMFILYVIKSHNYTDLPVN